MTGIVKTDQLQGAQGTTVTVPTGHTLAVTSNATVGGTLGVTGAMTTAAITSTGKHTVNFNGGATQAFKYTDTAGGNLASFGQFYNTSNALIGNVQNANNDGIHLNIKNGSIVFGNIGYTAANALDDYEEGTWTPNCATAGVSGSYSVQLGRYIKIGNLVQCIFNLTTSGSYTGSTSNVFKIGGLPFANKYYDGSLYAGGNIGYYFNINTSDSAKQMVYQIPSGSATSFELKGTGDNQGEISIIVSNMNSNSVIRGQLVYHTA